MGIELDRNYTNLIWLFIDIKTCLVTNENGNIAHLKGYSKRSTKREVYNS
jgi:hypothetical protein